MIDLEKRIDDLFNLIKLERNLKGYEYLKRAIILRYMNENYKGKIYSHLYKDLAIDLKSSVAAIERNIRTLLDVSWTKNYSNYQFIFYDCILIGERNIPTATRFIERTISLLDTSTNALNDGSSKK